MKISACYAYTIASFGYPPTYEKVVRAIWELHDLGYRAVELEGLGLRHMREVYAQRKDLCQICGDLGVRVHNFCAIDPELVSPDKSRRKRAMEVVRIGAEVAAELGSETLHLASYAPPLMFKNVPYAIGKKYTFDLNYRAIAPKGFSYPRLWDALVDSCREVARIAQTHGLRVIMEPRVGELIASSDSMLRLLEAVACPNFFANFDTAHFQAQKEYLALTLEKLKSRIGNIHVADNDARSIEHLPLGTGVIDWKEFFRVLRAQGYGGYLGVDIFLPRGRIRKAYGDAFRFLTRHGCAAS